MRTMEHDVTAQLKKPISKYEEAVHGATGMYPKLETVITPFIFEETRLSKHRAPFNDEDFIECPCCLHTIPESVAMSECKFASGTPRKVHELLPIVNESNCDLDEEPEFTSCRFCRRPLI